MELEAWLDDKVSVGMHARLGCGYSIPSGEVQGDGQVVYRKGKGILGRRPSYVGAVYLGMLFDCEAQPWSIEASVLLPNVIGFGLDACRVGVQRLASGGWLKDWLVLITCDVLYLAADTRWA